MSTTRRDADSATVPSCLNIPPYSAVKRMIKQAAWKFSRATNLPLEDMEAEADCLYAKACSMYTSDRKAKFSTFLHLVLRTGLINYVKKQAKSETPCKALPYKDADGKEVDPVDQLVDDKAHRKYGMIDFYESLTADEQELVELVLDGFASTLEAVKTLAMKRLGYDTDRFNEAVSGIRELLKEAA